ncbi:MAG TPA: hypothetical protein VGO56_19820 [Pyrinomonadaceae bacterium]|nr:hypothetical protein [Pyrinomonadaceae bacterium]
MKRLMLAATLACVLSATAIAGEIPSTGAPTPPPASNSWVVTAILTIISIVAK